MSSTKSITKSDTGKPAGTLEDPEDLARSGARGDCDGGSGTEKTPGCGPRRFQEMTDPSREHPDEFATDDHIVPDRHPCQLAAPTPTATVVARACEAGDQGRHPPRYDPLMVPRRQRGQGRSPGCPRGVLAGLTQSSTCHRPLPGAGMVWPASAASGVTPTTPFVGLPARRGYPITRGSGPGPRPQPVGTGESCSEGAPDSSTRPPKTDGARSRSVTPGDALPPRSGTSIRAQLGIDQLVGRRTLDEAVVRYHILDDAIGAGHQRHRRRSSEPGRRVGGVARPRP